MGAQVATEQEQAPPAEGVTPEETGGGIALTDEQQAVLKEHGIEVPEDGKIAVTDHLKLLSTLSNLRTQVKQTEQQKEQARLAALSEADRKIEEARAAGKAEAEAAANERIVKAQIKAEAAARGFSDPGDAFAMIPDLSALDAEDKVKAAVESLATAKPYLLKKGSSAQLETGPQGGKPTGSNPNDWLRSELAR